MAAICLGLDELTEATKALFTDAYMPHSASMC